VHWRGRLKHPKAMAISPGTLRRLDLRDEFLKQRQRIIFFPDQVKRKPDLHINHREQDNASGAVPAYRFGYPGNPDPASDKVQQRTSIDGLLNNVRGIQAAASALVRQ